MKRLLLLITIGVFAGYSAFSQSNNFWTQSQTSDVSSATINAQSFPSNRLIFGLELKEFKRALLRAPHRENLAAKPALIMSFPNARGVLERFSVMEAPLFHSDLAAKYPLIRSYAGQGIDNPASTIRFSVSKNHGFHGMVLSGTEGSYFIDPYNLQDNTYSVYARKDLAGREADFQCLTEEDIDLSSLTEEGVFETQSTNDKKLRKYRLALSCNAEYGNLFAGTGSDAQKKGNILSQMNITMTRVNGVYERDLAITLELVANNDAIIYYGNTSADPWMNEFNFKTQDVIDLEIGDENYDIGHNFNTSGGGNAGCIGCVCESGSKGSGYTGRPNPTGDAFDIDYVAHEMGHQFGGYHTMNTCSRSGNGATEVEPASGSSIMGYAGICDTNIQSNSDDYFHYVNIRDISANVQGGISAGCAQVIDLSNNPPVANAGPDYTIPRSTAFVLRGQGSDPDGDALTYTWEQNDPERGPSNGSPQASWAQGPMFRSRKGTSSPERYMPQVSDVIAGNLTPTWEVIPSVARTMEFALTVRDNKAGGGQTADDLMTVTVSGNSGPFVVNAPNTNVTWGVGQTQTVTWNVANTNSSPVNCATVNIKLSTDGGQTFPITLIAGTPNDGSEAITVPNNVSSSCRIKVEAADNIFYDISNANFTISGSVSCNATVPANVAASAIGANTATLNWTAVSGATYDVRYRVAGTSAWTTVNAPANTFNLTGLAANTTYQVRVRTKCGSTNSAYSSVVSFTTTGAQAAYCPSNGNSTSDEFIGRVQLGTINNSTGASAGGYGDYTSISTDLAQNSSNTITITPTWTGTVYNEGYGVWIDYNQDGDFSDVGEQVWTKSASNATPVTGSFTVPASAMPGPTRMRVSLRYNAVPASCGSFNYGEVEDYTVNIIGAPVGGCTDVTLSLTFDNYPEETSWALKNEGGATVASGGPYNDAADGSTITDISCLPAGCYTITVSDAYGDGICCSYGNGSYTLKDASGMILAAGSQFGTFETTNFCIESGGKESRGLLAKTGDKQMPVTTEIYPNPVDDLLNIRMKGESMKRLKVFGANGREIRNLKLENGKMDVSSLSRGVYFISMETNKEVIVRKFVKK